MRALVTGAAGFIGRHLVRSLLASGYEVVGVDNFATSHPADLARELGDVERFTFRELDVCSPELRRYAELEPFQVIYHLACPTGVPNLVPMALEMLETSYEGSKTVLDIARAHGSAILLTSTAEVYGNPLVSPQAESYTGNVDPVGPRNGYEEGKRAAESLFAIYHRRYGVPARIVRVFNTYGPGMALHETRVVPSFVRAALAGEPLPVFGDGSQTRCHTYVTDMVAGLRLVMERGVPGQAYNLGSTRQETVGDLARLVLQLTGSRSELLHLPRPDHDHDQRLPDIARATALGWRATVPLEDGLRETIDDFRRRLELTVPASAAQ